MWNKKKIIFLMLAVILFNTFIIAASAETLSVRLSGYILLQVEKDGEAWFVNGIDNQRYFLGRPSDAYLIMKKLGLGIKHEEFSRYMKTVFPRRLAGKILLDVEKNGEAYYVYPKDMSVHLSWYAVKLTDNNIYYGSSKDIKSNPLVLENSYYDAWGPFETPGIPDLNGRSIGIIGTTNIPQEKIKLIEPLAKESNLVKALMETGGGNKNIWLKH